MPTFRILKYFRGCLGPSYYRDLATNAPIICARELRRHIKLPTPCPEIQVITTEERPDHEDYFDIKSNGTLVGVRTELTTSFQCWLIGCYANGARYMYFDYEE